MYRADVVHVMIASPSDVKIERQDIRDIIYEWNAGHARERHLILLPVGWESHASPLMGDRPQAIINEQLLEQSDLLVAVFWTRLGSPTGEAPSGTVEEIRKHWAAGKPTMLYFSDVPFPPGNLDEAQLRDLRQFRKECEPHGFVSGYSSPEEFRRNFSHQLDLTIQRQFKAPPLTENSIPPAAQQPHVPSLSPEARELLIECSRDRNGTATCMRVKTGMIVETNNRSLSQGDARAAARWNAAVEELTNLRFLEYLHGSTFAITQAGYEAVDRLLQQNSA